jgi:endonuclease/exonuclease/phosphatase family metal-dependent hydrolase
MRSKKPNSKTRGSLFENLLKWVNLFVIFLALVSYLSALINPDKFWLPAVVGLGFPAYIVGNFLFAIYWLFRRRTYFWFSLLCLLAGLPHYGAWFNLSLGDSSGEDTITVMTFNTAGMHHFNSDKPETAQTYRQLFRSASPDILCVQEVYTDGALKGMLASTDYEGYFKSFGTAVFTSFPILESGNVQLDTFGSFAAWLDVEVNGKPLRVYSVHLKSNQFSSTALEVARHGDIREKRTWSQVKFIFSRYSTFVQVRARQVKQLAEHIRQSPHPVLVCGDFNDTPISYIYHCIAEDLQDSFKAGGNGFGFTFASFFPFLRIDYVFADPSIRILDHRVLRNSLSDHKPVVVELRI